MSFSNFVPNVFYLFNTDCLKSKLIPVFKAITKGISLFKKQQKKIDGSHSWILPLCIIFLTLLSSVVFVHKNKNAYKNSPFHNISSSSAKNLRPLISIEQFFCITKFFLYNKPLIQNITYLNRHFPLLLLLFTCIYYNYHHYIIHFFHCA